LASTTVFLHDRNDGRNPVTDPQRRKRHHFLAQSYMRPWADSEDHVAARRRGQPASFTTNLINVAVESNLYTAEGPSGPDDALEVELAEQVGGRIGDILELLRDDRVPRKESAAREEISHLLAVQLVRTPDHVGRMLFPITVADFCGERPVSRDGMRRYLAEVHLGTEPTESETEGALAYVNGVLSMGPVTKAEAFQTLFGVARDQLAPALRTMAWSVEICNRACFITSDLLLTVWRRRPDASGHTGTGLGSADEVWFPLGPHHLLALRPRFPEHRSFVEPDRVTQVNRHLASACNKLIIGRFQDGPLLTQLPLAATRPLLRFNSGPLLTRTPDGRLIDSGRTVTHMYNQYDERRETVDDIDGR
jgi:hypothetical protein